MVSFDTKTTTFSPSGNILQVEYAIKAVNSAGLCFAMKGKDSIVVFVEQKADSKLLDKSLPSTAVSTPSISSIPSKCYRIDSHFYTFTSGLATDCDKIVKELQRGALKNYTSSGTPMPISHSVQQIADWKQYLTQHGGNRPFAVSMVYVGVEDGELTLMSSTPSGYYGAYKAVAVGNESTSAMSELDALVTDSDTNSVNLSEMSAEELMKVGIKVIMKSVCSGATSLNAGKIEAYVFKQNAQGQDQAHFEWQDAHNTGMNPVDVRVVSYEELGNLALEAVA